MKAKCYLVIEDRDSKPPKVVKSTYYYPALRENQAVVHLSLELPDDLFDAPAFTVEVEKRQVEVAVEPQEVER